MAFPKSVRIFILSFLGETQDELRELPLVSKQFYHDCKEPGLGWELVPLFVLSAKDNNQDEGRTLNFIHTMIQYQHDNNTYRKLQRYSIFKVENMDKFDKVSESKLTMGTIRMTIIPVHLPLLFRWEPYKRPCLCCFPPPPPHHHHDIIILLLCFAVFVIS